MKSLLDSPFINTNPELFTPEIIQHILCEGFEYRTNDSYCFNDHVDEHVNFEDMCYKRKFNNRYGTFVITVYIFSIGIGVDVDYDCGGNSSTMWFSFKYMDFQTAYDEMVGWLFKNY